MGHTVENVLNVSTDFSRFFIRPVSSSLFLSDGSVSNDGGVLVDK